MPRYEDSPPAHQRDRDRSPAAMMRDRSHQRMKSPSDRPPRRRDSPITTMRGSAPIRDAYDDQPPYRGLKESRGDSPPYKILCVANLNHKFSDNAVRDALAREFTRYDVSVKVFLLNLLF